MVSVGDAWPLVELGLLIAELSPEILFERLDPSRQVAIVMALLGIVLVGIFLVAFVMLGANWTRRLARQSPRGRLLFSDRGFPSHQATHAELSIDAHHAFHDKTTRIEQSQRPTKPDR